MCSFNEAGRQILGWGKQDAEAIADLRLFQALIYFVRFCERYDCFIGITALALCVVVWIFFLKDFTVVHHFCSLIKELPHGQLHCFGVFVEIVGPGL